MSNLKEKEIYKGVDVLHKYLNDAPLKPEYDGKHSYFIVEEILEAVEGEQNRQTAVEWADGIINHAIKKGQLSPEEVKGWSDEDKLEYANKAEVKENEKND